MKDLPPEIQKLLEEHPAVTIVGMLLMGVLLMGPSPKKTSVPGLGGRRNGAWRGPGSYGKAPFGTQVSHRR